MSTEFYTVSIIEVLISLLLIYGFMHEDKVIKFEQNIKRIILGNYRRYKRLRKNKPVQSKPLYSLRAIRYNFIYKRYRKYSAKLIEYRFF
jgi:hypothetical protein